MLLALWSPKGGSGTSVFAAACAVAASGDAISSPPGGSPPGGVRLADLGGDQPAIFGLGADPELGLVDWLDAGPQAPIEALDRFLVEVAPGVALLPRGGAERLLAPVPAAEAGAALAVALGDGPVPAIADCGCADTPATRAIVEVADVAVVVVRGCYLALRRAVRAPVLARTTGIVLIEEAGRSLASREGADVLDLPVWARVPVKASTARAVDAGVLSTRLPETLARAANALVHRVGLVGAVRGSAA